MSRHGERRRREKALSIRYAADGGRLNCIENIVTHLDVLLTNEQKARVESSRGPAPDGDRTNDDPDPMKQKRAISTRPDPVTVLWSGSHYRQAQDAIDKRSGGKPKTASRLPRQPGMNTESPSWTPRVLSEYEVGRCVSAIEAIARTDKPIAEVGSRTARADDLEADLTACVNLVSADCGVRFWIRPSHGRLRYGFYREAWTLEAIDFLDRTTLDSHARAWISGLLFGYRADAIQHFIARDSRSNEKRRRA